MSELTHIAVNKDETTSHGESSLNEISTLVKEGGNIGAGNILNKFVMIVT